MGRLTLNVLLSFAQFEREVTGERIRDKIAASKKKGMWMGGQPALGYDVHDRKLVINEAEAKTVRMIFRRYTELKSVRELKVELDDAGIVTKAGIAADGSPYGSRSFGRGALYAMLQNRVYRGEITHKGASYSGEHQAIIDEGLFDQVQSILAANRTERVSRHNHDSSPLTGLLFDAEGERLTPSHALKKGVRYRYYVSHHLITGDKTKARGMRLPALGIEALIRNRVEAILANPEELTSILRAECDRAAIISSAVRKAKDFASLPAAGLGLALSNFVSRISVFSDRVAITIQPDALAAWILESPVAETDDGQNTTIITAPIRVQQRGQEMRLVFGAEDELPPGHAGLVRLLARAHTIRRRLFDERSSIDEVAQAEDMIASYVTRLVRLTFLAPDITASILSGRHDPDLTVSTLMADTRVPLEWTEQRRSFASA